MQFMGEFIWNPAWHRPGESLWSALNKISFCTGAPVADVLDFVAGKRVARPRSTLFAPDAPLAASLCARLGLGSSKAADLFPAVGLLSSERRRALQLALRWCPECLANAYHSAVFQDWSLLTCPWHGCRLLDRCQNCRRPVDPLGLVPWQCTSCGESLCRLPQGWLAAFKAAPNLAPVGEVSRLEEVSSAPAVTHFSAPEEIRTARAGDILTNIEARIVVSQQACEELSALLETELAGHRSCLQDHLHTGLLEFELVTFKCPVAAAVLRLAAWAGVSASCLESGWVPVDVPSHPFLAGRLWWEFEHMPAWCWPLYARACIRSWLVEALSAFVAAQDAGLACSWRPSTDSVVGWKLQHDSLTLKSATSEPNARTLAMLGIPPTCSGVS
jgi:hypothetical protein